MKDSTLVRQNSKFRISHKIRRKSCFEFKMKTGEKYLSILLVIINLDRKVQKKKKKSDPTMYTKIQKLLMSDPAMQSQNTKRVVNVRLK